MKIEMISQMSFEEAMRELESVVSKLEQGNESLDNVVSLYQYGAALKNHCEEKLNSAKLSVDKIIGVENGKAVTTKLDELESE